MTSKPTPQRFAILARVSTAPQTSGESPEVQLAQGKEYAKRLGGKVVATYQIQESGRKALAEREQFRAVLADARAGKWDALWTKDHTRLARNVGTMVELISFFTEHHIEWHTQMGRMPFDTPAGKMVVQMMSVMGEHDTDRNTAGTRDSRAKLLAEGKHAFGRWPWGRRWDKKNEKWIVDELKKRKLQLAYRVYVRQGRNIEQTAAAVGMPSSTLGAAIKTAGTDWLRILNTPAGKQEYVLKIPPLLTPAQIRAWRARAAKNQVTMPDEKHRRRWLLQGLVRCSECGGLLTGMPSSKNGTRYSVYRHNPKTRGEKCLWHIPADLIEKRAVEACAQIIADDKSLQAAIRAALDVSTSSGKAAKREERELESALKVVRAKLEREVTALVDTVGAARETLKVRTNRTGAQVEELERQLADTRNRLAAYDLPARDAEEIAARIRALVWRGVAPRLTMTPEQQRRLVTTVVGRTRRDDPQGIFVRMVRFGGKKSVRWPFEIRGALANAVGDATQFAEMDKGIEVRPGRLSTDPRAIERLAALAQEAQPLKLPPRKPLRNLPKLCSSSG